MPASTTLSVSFWVSLRFRGGRWTRRRYPVSLILGLFGMSAGQVDPNVSIFDLHRYLGVYLLTFGMIAVSDLAVTVSGSSVTANADDAGDKGWPQVKTRYGSKRVSPRVREAPKDLPLCCPTDGLPDAQ